MAANTRHSQRNALIDDTAPNRLDTSQHSIGSRRESVMIREEEVPLLLGDRMEVVCGSNAFWRTPSLCFQTSN